MSITKSSRKNFKASALAVTLIILGIIIASALSVSFVALKERRGSIGASKSSSAYQMAETGIEQALYEVLKQTPPPADTSKLSNCQNNPDLPMYGYIVFDNPPMGSYKVELKDEGGNKIECYSAADISTVRKIKSTGIVGQNSRAVQVSLDSCDPENGLIGHWKLDEGTGTVALDTHAGSPDPQDANITGASWFADKNGNSGKALNFDETNNDLAETPDRTDSAPGPYILNAGSISALINVDDILAANENYWMGWKQTIASWGSDQTAFSFMQWGLKYYPDYPSAGAGDAYPARIFMEWKPPCATGGDPHATLETTDLVDMRSGGWHRVTFSADGNNQVKIYWDTTEIRDLNFYQDDCDGVAGSGNANDFLADVRDVGVDLGWGMNRHSFSIGGCPHCAGAAEEDSYNGAIDDIRMYNRAIDECDIQQL